MLIFSLNLTIINFSFHSIIEKLSIRKKRILFDNKDKLTENLSLIVNQFFEKYKIDTSYLLPNFKNKTLETKSNSKKKMQKHINIDLKLLFKIMQDLHDQ